MKPFKRFFFNRIDSTWKTRFKRYSKIEINEWILNYYSECIFDTTIIAHKNGIFFLRHFARFQQMSHISRKIQLKTATQKHANKSALKDFLFSLFLVQHIYYLWFSQRTTRSFSFWANLNIHRKNTHFIINNTTFFLSTKMNSLPNNKMIQK